jgi:AraC family transcriptional regulator of arabinose operon
MQTHNIFPVLTALDLRLPIYVTSAGGWVHQEPIHRESGHHSFQWIQCLDGKGQLDLFGAKADVAKGQGMLLYAGVPHQYYAIEEPWSVQWVTFQGGVANELLERLNLRESGVYTVAETVVLEEQMDSIAEILKGHDPFQNVEVSTQLYRLLLNLSKSANFKSGASPRKHLQNLAPMLRLIETRYAEDLSLDDLADCMHVTPQYTCALFRRCFGMRPFEYVAKYRVQRAKELLIADRFMSVSEVGQRVGYPHTSYFIKLFKAQEGMTPNQFRQQQFTG